MNVTLCFVPFSKSISRSKFWHPMSSSNRRFQYYCFSGTKLYLLLSVWGIKIDREHLSAIQQTMKISEKSYSQMLRRHQWIPERRKRFRSLVESRVCKTDEKIYRFSYWKIRDFAAKWIKIIYEIDIVHSRFSITFMFACSDSLNSVEHRTMFHWQ